MRIPVEFHGVSEASKFVVLCNEYDEDINIYYKRFVIDAKSILGVLSCDFRQPIYAEILTEDLAKIDQFAQDVEEILCGKMTKNAQFAAQK